MEFCYRSDYAETLKSVFPRVLICRANASMGSFSVVSEAISWVYLGWNLSESERNAKGLVLTCCRNRNQRGFCCSVFVAVFPRGWVFRLCLPLFLIQPLPYCQCVWLLSNFCLFNEPRKNNVNIYNFNNEKILCSLWGLKKKKELSLDCFFVVVFSKYSCHFRCLRVSAGFFASLLILTKMLFAIATQA